MLRRLCEGVPGVARVAIEPLDSSGHANVTIESKPGLDLRCRLAAAIVGGGHELFELRAVRLSLEEIFLQLTTEETHGQGSAAAPAGDGPSAAAQEQA